jgi:hypothetical protein
VFRDWLEDVNSKPDRFESDRRLGDVALVVGGEHLPILARQMRRGARGR